MDSIIYNLSSNEWYNIEFTTNKVDESDTRRKHMFRVVLIITTIRQFLDVGIPMIQKAIVDMGIDDGDDWNEIGKNLVSKFGETCEHVLGFFDSRETEPEAIKEALESFKLNLNCEDTRAVTFMFQPQLYAAMKEAVDLTTPHI